MLKITLAALLAFCLFGTSCLAAGPPPDTRMHRPSDGALDGVRWGSEPYEPSTPKPDHQQRLKRSSDRDPDIWRTKRTNRRDPADNSPNR